MFNFTLPVAFWPVLLNNSNKYNNNITATTTQHQQEQQKITTAAATSVCISTIKGWEYINFVFLRI